LISAPDRRAPCGVLAACGSVIQPNKTSSTGVAAKIEAPMTAANAFALAKFRSPMLHVLAYLAELGVVVASSVFTVLAGHAIRSLWTSMGGGRS